MHELAASRQPCCHLHTLTCAAHRAGKCGTQRVHQHLHGWAFDHPAIARPLVSYSGLHTAAHSAPSLAAHNHEPHRDAWVLYRQLHNSAHSDDPPDKKDQHSLAPLVDNATPENCDRIVEELRYRNIRIPAQLDLSLRRRIQSLFAGIVKAVVGTLRFVYSMPRRLVAAARMTPTEWKETLVGWWQTLKHEAKHYWVRRHNDKARRAVTSAASLKLSLRTFDACLACRTAQGAYRCHLSNAPKALTAFGCALRQASTHMHLGSSACGCR